MAVKLKWHGRRYKEGLYKHVDKKVEKYANKLQKNTKALAPKKTGDLKRSIVVTKQDQMQYRVQSDLPYALYIEFGTSKKPARPYFRPAINRTKGL